MTRQDWRDLNDDEREDILRGAVFDSGCPVLCRRDCDCGCEIEPDGHCPDGCPSILIALGMI